MTTRRRDPSFLAALARTYVVLAVIQLLLVLTTDVPSVRYTALVAAILAAGLAVATSRRHRRESADDVPGAER